MSALSEQGFSGERDRLPGLCRQLLSHYFATTTDITMYEALVKDYEPAPFTSIDVSLAIDRIRVVEAKKERRREIQIADAQRKRDQKKRELEEVDAEGTSEAQDGRNVKARLDAGTETPDAQDSDRADKTDSTAVATGSAVASLAATSAGVGVAAKRGGVPEGKKSAFVGSERGPKQYTFKPTALNRGHTSYLTFATLLPTALSAIDAVAVTSNEQAD